MLNFEHIQFLSDPYPIGFAAPVMDDAVYHEMANSFPSLDRCKVVNSSLRKSTYVLADHPDPKPFFDYVAEYPIWTQWDKYIRGPQFLSQVRQVIKQLGVKVPLLQKKCYPRWTFTVLGHGACLPPHTDAACKIVTLALSMRHHSERWEPSWKGSTDVLKSKDPTQVHPYPGRFEDFDVVHRYPYGFNQCVMFIKSDTSWHSVGPWEAPHGQLRKAVIVNIESEPLHERRCKV